MITNRLKVILAVGGIAIAGTYALTQTGDNDSAPDSAYQQQLEQIRNKNKAQTDSKRSETYNNLNAEKEKTVSDPSFLSAPQLTEHIKHHVNSTLQSLKQILPAGQEPAPPEANDTQSRISYLQSMPVGLIEATHKADAVAMARLDAGREDPFASLSTPKAFPRAKEIASKLPEKLPKPDLGSGPEGLPPPPPGASELPPGMTPPSLEATNLPPGISSDELPPPPEKPLLMRMLRLNGIVGDRAILTFKDRRYQRNNGYQKYITLAEGQSFDNMRVVDVETDKAVLEEDGEQTTVHLAPIR